MTMRRTLAALLLATAPFPAIAADDVGQQIQADMPSLMALYRDLHANPELSFAETRTARVLATEARKAGFEVTEGVGRTGIVAVMKNGPGPVVMVRADMDGLPVTEATGLPFASKVRTKTPEGIDTGVMHACGHDTHMTGWVAVARTMAANKARWSGTLVMIGQPAEERGNGAGVMIKDGLLTRFPKPDYALAFHDAAGAPAGMIGYSPGFALANVDTVDLTIKGVGGHGAYPATTKDPIVLASRIVTTLQTLVSRELDPTQEQAVVTVGSFQAGTKHNIISDEARLLITVRSYADKTRDKLLKGIERIARGEAIAAGVPEDRMPVMTIDPDYYPATYNTPEFTVAMGDLLKTRFGEARVRQMPPVMGGEDFGMIQRADNSIKSMIFWVGGVPRADYDKAMAEGRPLPSLHSPFWAPDAEKVIAAGAEALTVMAMHLMPKQ